jgi:hypothetical protein
MGTIWGMVWSLVLLLSTARCHGSLAMIGELPCEPVRFCEEGLVLELMTWAGGACLGLRLNFFAFDWCFSVEVARAIHTGLGIIEKKKIVKRKGSL